MELISIISKAETALRMLQVVKPMLGENEEIVETVADVVGRALGGVKFGTKAYTTLVDELNGVIAELEAIKANGGKVTGNDFRAEVDRINTRGAALDALKDKLS